MKMQKYRGLIPLLLIVAMVVFVTLPENTSAKTPDTSYYSNQWYLKRIKADKAWPKLTQNASVVVAVIDSGVQIDHPDLISNIWLNTREIADNDIDDDGNGYIDDLNGWDFVNNTADPSPKFKLGFTENGITHGTLVAGILAANGEDNLGISGVSWKTKIMPLKVLTDSGKGSTLKIIEAIDYAIANDADIINLSFVGFGYSKSLENAIRRAYEAGIIVVAAGGNEEGEGLGSSLDKKPLYPVCHDGKQNENMVIGVAATDPLDQRAYFSGYGSCIDVSAPGISIYGASVYNPGEAKMFNKYYDGYWSGTSLAVPMVSGTIALIKQANPSLSTEEVKDVLLSTTDNINLLNPRFVGKLGTGRINVKSAVEIALARLGESKIGLAISSGNGNIQITDFKGEETSGFDIHDNNINISGIDINNDYKDEIVTVPITGKVIVKIHDKQGKLLNSFVGFDDKIDGASLAVGDVNNDGKDEIIIGAGAGRQPEIKIFTASGKLLNSFNAYAHTFSGGVSVAVGDTDNDGILEIVTVPASNGGAHVRYFNFNGRVLGGFFAYDKKIRNGFKVAVANIFNNSRHDGGDIIVMPNGKMPSYIKIFNKYGDLRKRFAVFNTGFVGVVDLKVGDMDNDGLEDIVVSAILKDTIHVKIIKGSTGLIKSLKIKVKEINKSVSTAIISLR